MPTVPGHSSAHRGRYRHLPVALGPWMSSQGAVRARTQLPSHQGLSACFLLCRHAAHEARGQALREALGSHRLHTSQVMTAVTSHPYWALPEPRPLPGRPRAANKPRPQPQGVTKLCYVHAMGRCEQHRVGGRQVSVKRPGAAAQQNTTKCQKNENNNKQNNNEVALCE